MARLAGASHSNPRSAPNLVIALRHGEKPADAEEEGAALGHARPGLDSDGDVNRRSLTLRGWQRSGALAATHLCGLLANARGSVTVLVPRYAHTEHHRAYQTVRALADRLEAAVEDSCEAADVDALEQRVLEADATVVICWEHDALVTFTRRLAPAAPADWPHGRFDVLWLLHRQADGGG